MMLSSVIINWRNNITSASVKYHTTCILIADYLQ